MDFDVVVVGGGMVGGTLACALAEGGLSVAIVEAGPPRPLITYGRETPFDIRVSALTRASEAILRRLGLWEGIERRRLAPFREMLVWDAGGDGAIRFDSADIGEPTLGHIVENGVVVAAVEERLATLPGVSWLRPERPVGLEIQVGSACLQLPGTAVEATLVVGADGARSRLRELAGIGLDRTPYGHSALVATVRTELPHDDTAWQRFLPTGPLAFLPLPDGYSSIVWSVPPERAEALLGLPDDAFARELEDAFERRLGRVVWLGERAVHPLYRQHAECYVRPRIALVGDAAHTIHPLAGQGVNLGLLDAAALAEVVLAARRAGRDVGDLAVLRRYERWRRGHNLLVQGAMDGFRLLFGTGLAPLRLIRNLGLRLVDGASPVKRMIMRRAMGLEGDLPPLAR